jgi:hypothetical protein
MSDDRLQEIRQRVDRASPGTWYHHSAQKGAGEDQWISDFSESDEEYEGHPDDWEPVVTNICELLEMDYYMRYPRTEFRWRKGDPGKRVSQARRNFQFIAHAREDVPYLLDHIDKLERENEMLRKDVETEHKHLNGCFRAMRDALAENERLRGILSNVRDVDRIHAEDLFTNDRE